MLVCCGVTFGCYFAAFMCLPVVPLHAQTRGLDVSQIGIVFFAQGLCNGASRIPFGRLSDRVPRRNSRVVIGIVLYTVALSGGGLSQTMGHFVLSAGLLGISMGLAFTSAGALIAEVVPPAFRGSATGGYNTCIYLGMMLSSVIMGAVSETIGFTMGFLLTAGVNLVFLGLFWVCFKNGVADRRR